MWCGVMSRESVSRGRSAAEGIVDVAVVTSDGLIPAPSPRRAAAMIKLLVLDAARDCLRRPRDPPNCICRAPKHHAGPHEYVPVDMVVVTGEESSEERRVGIECVSPCQSRWRPYP